MYNGAHVLSIAEYFHNKRKKVYSTSRSHTLALLLELVVHSRAVLLTTYFAKNIYSISFISRAKFFSTDT